MAGKKLIGRTSDNEPTRVFCYACGYLGQSVTAKLYSYYARCPRCNGYTDGIPLEEVGV